MAAPAPATRATWVETEARVLANDRLPGKRHHYAVVEVPEGSPMPEAGQFYMLAPSPSASDALLRRPMSVARAWRAEGRIRLGFLYTVIGRGTRALARARDAWSILGPLGRGYPMEGSGPKILVGGGRGVAPLVLLAEACARRSDPVVFLNGARTESDLCSPEEMGAVRFAPGSVSLEATEDGTHGVRGLVTDLFAHPAVTNRLAAPGATFYSCGPHGLLAAVGRAAHERSARAWVALEANMACGTGICRSCVVPRANGVLPGPAATNASYLLTCLDGPCVEAGEVDWEHAP